MTSTQPPGLCLRCGKPLGSSARCPASLGKVHCVPPDSSWKRRAYYSDPNECSYLETVSEAPTQS